MKYIIYLFLTCNLLFSSTFKYDIVDNIVVKNSCHKKEIKNGFFKLEKCLNTSDEIFFDDLECIYGKTIICSSQSKNFILSGDFKVKDKYVYINSFFIEMMEIKYIVQ